MVMELRASDQRVAALQASQAIDGIVRQMSNLLATVETNAAVPILIERECRELPVGEARAWLIGRDTNGLQLTEPVWGMVDEAAKLNLNTATAEMLEYLPRMTPELAAAIVDWRDSDEDAGSGGAESDIYLRQRPAYRCKNANFESVEELRLVYGMELEILEGEDLNRNGVLDINENDGEASTPYDNRDGRLDPGLLEYVTVYTHEPNTRSDGTARINVSDPSQAQQLQPLLQEKLGQDRATAVMTQLRTVTQIGSVLEFYLASGLTQDEFSQIETEISTTDNTSIEGLVNVNTASQTVLTCIPGIGPDLASSVVAYRQSNVSKLGSIAWVADAISRTNALQAGRYLTVHSYQYSVDIAAVGQFGRGYQRVRVLFDNSTTGSPRVACRQDLTGFGWALGRETRLRLAQAKANR
jgi:DNA uptake protein ComE-like DNA-binding protein